MTSAIELARAVREGRRTAIDIVEEAIERIARDDAAINSFIDRTFERAKADAIAIDARRRLGQPLPALAGVPYAVKNLFDVAGLVTLSGGKVNASDAAASNDAVLVQRMSRAGAVLMGTLNMDEHAYGFTTENTHFGPTRNPHDRARVAGGSSGGSAAAVAAGLVPLTLGSDTNGSIRVPASLCGVFGLKPHVRQAVAFRVVSLRLESRPSGTFRRDRRGPRRHVRCAAGARFDRRGAREASSRPSQRARQVT